MKLNEAALEVATQAEWENWGYQGRFREQSANPDFWPCHASRIVTAYLDALNPEGLADLHDYWSERVKALPDSEVREGDTYAVAMDDTNESRWYVNTARYDLGKRRFRRVLRRAPQPRQWAIGDLVDETRDLPEGTVVRDEAGQIAEYLAKYDAFTPIGIDALWILDALEGPRIIWLPENEDKS